jgi:hypothetical protein
MRRFKRHPQQRSLLTIVALFLVAILAKPDAQRWSQAQANTWYEQQPWLVGSNYVPADAINQLEMWQEATFDPQEIDKELGWAEGLGMNTMRVFLHNLSSNTESIHS